MHVARMFGVHEASGEVLNKINWKMYQYIKSGKWFLDLRRERDFPNRGTTCVINKIFDEQGGKKRTLLLLRLEHTKQFDPLLVVSPQNVIRVRFQSSYQTPVRGHRRRIRPHNLVTCNLARRLGVPLNKPPPISGLIRATEPWGEPNDSL